MNIIEIVATVADVLMLIWFVTKFNHTTPTKRPVTAIVPAILLVFQLFGDQFFPNFSLIYAIGFFVLALVYALLICEKKYFKAVLSVCLYMAVVLVSNTAISNIIALAVGDLEETFQGAGSDVRIIYIVLCQLVHFTAYKILLFVFKSDDSLDLKNSILVMSFTSLTIFGLGALMSISTKVEDRSIKIVILILTGVFLFSNVLVYGMVYVIQKLLTSKYELKLLQERIAFEEARTHEAATIWDKIKKVRHELKNHVAVISGQLERENIEEARKYLDTLAGTVDNMGNLIRSNNAVLDYLINSKLSNLPDTQIIISGCVGGFSDISDTDLASMIGNILDNAVEALKTVTTEKKIELHFLMENKNRMIVCKNSISKSVLKSNRTLQSTKIEKEYHGLGHQIVESIVRKYSGIIGYYETDDNMFGVQIVLPEKSAE